MRDEAPVAGKDPPRNAVPGQEAVYQTIQSLWSAWARRRFRDEFARVEAFCLFIGYPRSGHSIVGAMLNAHRHAVVSHELDAPRLILSGSDRYDLYSRILARAAWFNLRGNTSNYRYQIPNRWQGRFETIRVIGDKGGGWVAQRLGQHPDLLRRTRDTVGVPVRLIHVVRNPFDNIASISLWHRLSLDESIDFYFAHCGTTGTLQAVMDDAEMITIRHEEFVRSPAPTLSALCSFLGLQPDAEYLEACSSIVFERPTSSRRRIAWTAEQVKRVERRARPYRFLEGYGFEMAREASSVVGSSRPPPKVIRPRFPVRRIGAWLNPRVRAAPGPR